MSPERMEEIKRYFGAVAEGLRNDIGQVAEGAAKIDEKLERFCLEVAQEFKEVKAMIKFSCAELDRRVRAPGETMVSLQARVERLEARPSVIRVSVVRPFSA